MSRRGVLRGLMAQVRATAARIIASGQEHASLLVLLREGRRPVEIEVGAFTVPEGETLNDVLRARLQARQAWGYIYINEAWTTTAVSRVVRGEVARVLDLPRDDRQEELIMVGVLQGEAPALVGAVIEATPTGRRLGPWRALDVAAFLGDASVVTTW